MGAFAVALTERGETWPEGSCLMSQGPEFVSGPWRLCELK
jgi:hypothetical protein